MKNKPGKIMKGEPLLFASNTATLEFVFPEQVLVPGYMIVE